MAFSLTDHALDHRALTAEFENQSLEAILHWCWNQFGEKAAIGTSFQGSGLVILETAARENLPFPIFTLDTGLLFPETLQLQKDWEQRLGRPIEGLHPEETVEQQAQSTGPDLWKTNPDTCCYLRKVVPLQKKLATLDCWITGLRRHQSDDREKTQILELYPYDTLREHYLYKLNPMANWSREQVWQFIGDHRLPYNPLHDRGYRSIGCQPCTRPVAEGENERAGRWTGFEKAECGIHTFLGENI